LVLGIMGLADMLIKMGITYGTDEAVHMCHNIGFAMADTAIATSALLAKDKALSPNAIRKLL
jgi:ribonucleoside-diphosphate reductase alpha chain